MALKPNEIQNIIQTNTETFVQSVNNFKSSLDECKIKLSNLFERIEVVEKKLESSASKIDKEFSYFNDKSRIIQDFMYSGVTDGIDELINDIAFRLEELFDKYDKYIVELKKTIESINENTMKLYHFKKWYVIGKAVLIWILLILGVLFLLQHFLLAN